MFAHIMCHEPAFELLFAHIISEKEISPET